MKEQTDAMERARADGLKALNKSGQITIQEINAYDAGWNAHAAALEAGSDDILEAERERLVNGLLALRASGKVQFDINDDEVSELLVGRDALEAGKAVDENGLKPCPFCGGEADLLKAKPDDAWPEDYVTCKNHDCDIFGNYSATVESWNRRAR
jgi:hypothetical protein